MSKSLFDLDRSRPQLMAVLNVTPDSFSDGGSYYQQGKLSLDLCRSRVDDMIAEGASIIDIGGESTRPGAEPVSLQQEMDRVLPVIEAIQHHDVVISLDSSRPELMQEASSLGVGLINDVRALQLDGALEVAAATGLPVCLMHMQGNPQTMQNNPQYSGVIDEVSVFFEKRIAACNAAGISNEKIILDPGFGFGKKLAHNAELLCSLDRLSVFGLPLLVGLSRKSMIAQVLGDIPADKRLAGSLALAVMAVERGAWIVRAHDIRATAEAMAMAAFVMRAKNE